jgi:hypothetical protein
MVSVVLFYELWILSLTLMPCPLSVIIMLLRPPSLAVTLMLVLPASSEFSSNSLIALEGLCMIYVKTKK